MIDDVLGTTRSNGEILGFALTVVAITLTGSPAAWAKMVGVSAMSPRSTEPPVSAAMIGGPPTNSCQLTVYCAPFNALAAVRMVWYSLNWSAKVMVTPDRLREVFFDAADASGAANAVVAPTASTVAPIPPTRRRSRRWRFDVSARLTMSCCAGPFVSQDPTPEGTA